MLKISKNRFMIVTGIIVCFLVTSCTGGVCTGYHDSNGKWHTTKKEGTIYGCPDPE